MSLILSNGAKSVLEAAAVVPATIKLTTKSFNSFDFISGYLQQMLTDNDDYMTHVTVRQLNSCPFNVKLVQIFVCFSSTPMLTVNDVNHYLQYLARISIWGAVTKTILSPIERTKLVLQNQNSCLQVLRGERKPYPGILSCLVRFPKEQVYIGTPPRTLSFRKLVSLQGVLSYWRGNGTNILRYFPTQLLNSTFNDLYRAVFPIFMKNSKYGKSQFAQNFVAGGTAASTALLFVYPLDLCQTKLAVDIGGGIIQSNTIWLMLEVMVYFRI